MFWFQKKFQRNVFFSKNVSNKCFKNMFQKNVSKNDSKKIKKCFFVKKSQQKSF